MAAPVKQTVLIEFISDSSQLESSTDRLEEQGKVSKKNAEEFKKTNAELLKQQKAIEGIAAITRKLDEAGKVTQNNLRDLAKIIKSQSTEFQTEIKKGIIESLNQAGVSAKEFEEAFGDAVGSSVRQQLRSMVGDLARMKAEGKDNTEQYKILAKEAGHLKDAIGDANQEVKNFGSDTSTFDGLIGIAQGVAGGFAVAQGAVALFGDESEELQKVLLRVNATMAILQGLQQLQITLQKESAAATLADTIVTRARTAAQVAFNFVVGTSSGLLKVFRIALAATGVGLLVIGIIELVSALKSSNDAMEDANDLLERQKRNYESLIGVINQRVSVEEAKLREVLALESEIIKVQGRGLVQRRIYLVEQNKQLLEQRSALKATSEEWFALNKRIDENADAIKDLDADLVVKQIDLERKLVEERLRNIAAGYAAQVAASKKNTKQELELKKLQVIAERDLALNAEGLTQNERLRIIAESNKKIRDLNREFQLVLQEDRIAGIEAALSEEIKRARANGERIGQAEIDLQKQLVQEKADLQLLQEGLTANQILEIKTKSLNDQLKLQKDFNNQVRKESIEDLISRNNRLLSLVEVSDAKRLSLTIENIMAAAKMEIDANLGNSDKIKEIIAKRDKEIRDAKIASIEAIAEYEIEFTTAHSGKLLRITQDELDAQNQIRNASSNYERKRIEKETGFKRITLQEELRLIDLLTAYQSGAVQKRIDALNDERAKGLISQKDYNLKYEKLVDEQAEIVENGEKKKRQAINDTAKSAQEQVIEITKSLVGYGQMVSDVLAALYDLQSQRENVALEKRKRELEDLKNAGAITEKEAIIRQKRIEAEERRIRRQQAERDKTIATFNAFLAVPQAVLKGLAEGGPILAAIYGGLALAQALIIASRPIPKFGKGKKNKYEGPAEVGETGTELIESNGKMYVASKRQFVWLGKDDKVFNPQETKAMLSKAPMNTERVGTAEQPTSSMAIDYVKMGKEVGKHVKTDVYVDGVHAKHIEKQSMVEYLNWKRG